MAPPEDGSAEVVSAPQHAHGESQPRFRFPYTIFADMDGTVVERPPSGLYPGLDESPCWGPICQWLELGGRLVIITTANLRSVTQFWQHIPLEARRRRQVWLAMGSGALLFTSDAAGAPVAMSSYRATALQPTTSITLEDHQALLPQLAKLHIAQFQEFCHHPELIERLSDKYHEPIRRFLADCQHDAAQIAARVTTDLLTTPGGIMHATNERYISAAQPLVALRRCQGEGAAGSTEATNQQSDLTQDPALLREVTNVVTMGFHESIAPRYFAELEPFLAEHGLEQSFAPNSVWIYRRGLDKAVVIDWFRRTDAATIVDHLPDAYFKDIPIALDRAVALGDSPHSNDGPMGRFGDQGLPFVSVAAREDNVPAEHRALHIGGQEHGSAHFLTHLMDNLLHQEARSNTDSPLDAPTWSQAVQQAVHAARHALSTPS